MDKLIMILATVSVALAIPSPEALNCRKACTREYRPVCGNDQQTYANDCVFLNGKCRNVDLQAIRSGRCDDDLRGGTQRDLARISRLNRVISCLEICPRVFDPVCASNGRTYSSQCELRNANCRYPDEQLEMASEGQCRLPVMESYQKAMQRNTARGGNSGFAACFRPCPRHFRAVCASNNVTYANQCVFEVANCRERGQLSLTEQGRCVDEKSVVLTP